MPHIRFAGQITGVEGYIESAAIGLCGPLRGRRSHGRGDCRAAGHHRARRLLAHITRGADAATFQPMNVNFGLFPPLELPVKKAERKPALARAGRARCPAGAAAEAA